jgi:hypothetical protein
MVDSGMTRRAMIGGSLSVVAATGMPFPALAQPAVRTVAVTRYGKVRGRREDGIVKFLGVPCCPTGSASSVRPGSAPSSSGGRSRRRHPPRRRSTRSPARSSGPAWS